MKNSISFRFLTVKFLLVALPAFLAAQTKPALVFTVSMDQPATHYFHVELDGKNFTGDTVEFKMPVWSPGYYQRLDFANNVENFNATDGAGKILQWEKNAANGWKVYNMKSAIIRLTYDVKTSRPFVGTPYLDEERGYILPAGVIFNVGGLIQLPVTIIVKPFPTWNRAATGLDSITGKPFTYTAPDFDILYDSPILVGNLEELPPFTVGGIPHRFIGHKLGDFDRVQFMSDLKRVVETASGLIGDIPYKHYTFIAIGPGGGGIEHLNSTSVSFSGTGLNNRESRIRMLHFLAHEYYHHYNVKRIRPIELGPFDYDNGSRTKMLWVSEGLSVYYEYLIVKRAGLSTEDEMLNSFRGNMMAYENKPGKLYQSLTQSSYETWSDGPIITDPNKTISYYDKGPVIGLMLDFAIRHESKNKKSLDDVMRVMYHKYYQQKKRGFTEDEYRAECEQAAGTSLAEIFEYISTVKEPDYKKYFAYGGLDIDTSSEIIPGGWLGIGTRQRNDSVFISTVDFNSPASNVGIKPRASLLEIDGMPARDQKLESVLKNKMPGDSIRLELLSEGIRKSYTISLGQKNEHLFRIKRMPNPDRLQSEILKDWLD